MHAIITIKWIHASVNFPSLKNVTFKLINKGLLVDNRRLDFRRFQMLFDLVADKRGLEGHLNFLAQIFELRSYCRICEHLM